MSLPLDGSPLGLSINESYLVCLLTGQHLMSLYWFFYMYLWVTTGIASNGTLLGLPLLEGSLLGLSLDGLPLCLSPDESPLELLPEGSP